MNTIYKYDLEWGKTTIKLPKDATPLYGNIQYGVPRIWVKIDTSKPPTEERVFAITGTGHPIPDGKFVTPKYIGSFIHMDGDLVWHLWWIT